MVLHSSRTLSRIQAYRRHAERIRRRLTAAAEDDASRAPAQRLMTVLEDLRRIDGLSLKPGLLSFQKDVAAIRALLAETTGQSRFQEAARRIRRYAARQEYALALCRTTARRLKEECRMLLAAGPPVPPFVSPLLKQAEDMLRTPAPAASPR
jgi:hypothetical protein